MVHNVCVSNVVEDGVQEAIAPARTSSYYMRRAWSHGIVTMTYCTRSRLLRKS